MSTDIPSGPPSSSAFDVAVVGAGVVGMATAWALARRGLSVALLEKDQGPGRGTSFANGAQLSYSYTDALASPSLLKKLPGLIFGADPSLHIRKSVDPEFLRWGLAFLRNSSRQHFAANTVEGLRLGLESRLAMQELLDRHPLQFGHHVSGKMHLFYDAGAFRGACEVMALKRAHGAQQEALSPREAREMEPGLTSAEGLVGVIHSPEEAVGDPYRFCESMLQLLEREYKVSAHFGFDLDSIRAEQGGVLLKASDGNVVEARQVAICMGIGAPSFLRRMGIRVPIWPMKGYSFSAPLAEQAPRISITDTARKIVFCRLNDQLRVAGLAELGNWNAAVDPRRLGSLAALAEESLPEAADYKAINSGWAGLRPMSPTSLPIIGQPVPHMVLNVGHGMLGWTYALGAAERAAALLGKSSSKENSYDVFPAAPEQGPARRQSSLPVGATAAR